MGDNVPGNMLSVHSERDPSTFANTFHGDVVHDASENPSSLEATP